MTTKERIELMVWCQNAVIAAKLQEATLQIEQLKLLQKLNDIHQHNLNLKQGH